MTNSPQFTVQNAQRKVSIDLGNLRAFAARALQHCLAIKHRRRSELQHLSEVHIVLVSDSRMAALHKKFMNIRGATDVLTFQHGEVFISVETARENAARFQTTLLEEVRLYLVHGLLHLHGFDDTSREEARLMASRQSRLLAAASR